MTKFKIGLAVFSLLFVFKVEATTLQPNGLHYQPWLKVQNQYSVKESLAEAKSVNKGLVILFEQTGCAYCEKLHNDNFSYEDVTDYMTKHFTILQMDMRGDRQVKLLNGKVVSEKEFSRSLAVTNTPTTLFLRDNGTEHFRMPGYIQAAVYKAGFQYVLEKGPESGVGFIPWVKALIKRTRAQPAAK